MNARSCLPPWWPRPGNATARNSSASVCQSLVFLTRGTFSFCFLIWPWRAQHKDWNEQWTNHINSQSKSLRRLSKADTCTSFFFFLEGTLVPWVGFSPRKHLKSQQNVHFFVPHVKLEKKNSERENAFIMEIFYQSEINSRLNKLLFKHMQYDSREL